MVLIVEVKPVQVLQERVVNKWILLGDFILRMHRIRAEYELGEVVTGEDAHVLLGDCRAFLVVLDHIGPHLDYCPVQTNEPKYAFEAKCH